MRPVIVELVDFVEKMTPGAILAPAVGRIGEKEVRVVAIKLLGWLKERAREGRQLWLAFKKSYPWCQNLLLLLETPPVAELFEVDGNRIDFHDNIEVDERQEIEKYVDLGYKPRVTVLRRKEGESTL
jgi:hypothetical protein